jgi:hypothetical protein
VDREHRTQQRCDPAEERDLDGSCGPPPGPQSASSAIGHDGHGGDGEMEAPLPDSLDVGERQLGVTEAGDQPGDEPCAQEPTRRVVQYDGYWDVTPRMPERPLPPPPADMTDAKAVAKWRDRCWMLRNIFGSGN